MELWGHIEAIQVNLKLYVLGLWEETQADTRIKTCDLPTMRGQH